MRLTGKCDCAGLLFAGILALGTAPSAWAYSDPDPAPFFIRGLSNKCIDAGVAGARYAGQPIVLADCNKTPAQEIDIVEVSADRHEVILKASDYCIGPKDGALKVGVAFELQLCDNTAAQQRFGIDGDSIISFAPLPPTVYARSRLVAAAARGKWANGTPVVLVERMLADSEIWTFVPVFAPTTNAPPNAMVAQSRLGDPYSTRRLSSEADHRFRHRIDSRTTDECASSRWRACQTRNGDRVDRRHRARQHDGRRLGRSRGCHDSRQTTWIAARSAHFLPE